MTWNLEMPKQAYQEIYRVLKNKGHLLNIDGNHYYHYQDHDYQRNGHSDHQHMEGIDVSIIDTIAKDLMLSFIITIYSFLCNFNYLFYDRFGS